MKKIVLLILILILTPIVCLHAEELYFTYVGTIIEGGLNKIEYSDWFVDRRETKNYSGSFYSGGLLIDIFIKRIIGEFSIQYIYNKNSGTPDISIQHMIYNALGKYSYTLREDIFLTSGVGLYLETPPADRGYDSGGGFLITMGTIYCLNREWNFIFDLMVRYGLFGMGEESTKFSSGIKFGLVYKVGRV